MASSATMLSDTMMAIASRGMIYIYDLANGKVEFKFDREYRLRQGLFSSESAPTAHPTASLGENKLVVHANKSIKVYDIINGSMLSSVSIQEEKVSTSSQLLEVYYKYAPETSERRRHLNNMLSGRNPFNARNGGFFQHDPFDATPNDRGQYQPSMRRPSF